MFCYAETPVYSRLEVAAGEFVELSCNTSHTGDVMWTYDTGDPSVQYVYWKGHAHSDKPQLAIKPTRVGVHSLLLSDVHLNDSGLYNCYDDNGLRKIGYQLIVNGMCWFIYTYTRCVNSNLGTHRFNGRFPGKPGLAGFPLTPILQ